MRPRSERTPCGWRRDIVIGPPSPRIPRHRRPWLGAATAVTVTVLFCLVVPSAAADAGPSAGAPPPAGEAAGSPSGPAGSLTAATVTPTSLQFAGYAWQVKSSTSPIGPGPNLFDAKGPRVAPSGAMRLRIVKVGSLWESSEVVLDPTLGYGTYAWTVHGPAATLDPNVVLALFTYDGSDTPPWNGELDFEASRFGNAFNPTNAQYAVQPYDLPGNLQRISLPGEGTTTLSMTWVPGRVTFSGYTVKGKRTFPLPTWTNTSTSVPTASTEQVHMSLWLFRGAAPTNGKPVAVDVTGFTFRPAG